MTFTTLVIALTTFDLWANVLPTLGKYDGLARTSWPELLPGFGVAVGQKALRSGG